MTGRAPPPSTLIIALVAVAAPAPAAPEARLVPAWSGYVVAGTATELRLTLRTPGAAALEIRQDTPPVAVVHRLRTEPGTPRTVHLPVLTVPGHTATLELSVDGRPAPPLRWTPRWLEGVRLVATTLASPLPERDRLRYVRVARWELPRTAEGYRTAAATVIARHQLATLDPDQRAALFRHAGSCGRVLLVGGPGPAWDTLRAAAGCGGRGVRRIAAGEPVHPAVLELLATASVPAPAPGAGRAAEDLRGPVARHVVLFLLGYLAIAAVAAWRLPAWGPLALSLAAAGLAAAAWSSAVPRTAWLQAGGGEAPQRASLVAAGTGRGTLELRLPRGLGLPVAGRGFTGARLALDHDDPGGLDLHFAGALLSTGWLRFAPAGEGDP